MKARIFSIALCVLTILLVIFGVRGMYTAILPSGSSIDTVLRLASYAAENHPSTMAAQFFAEQVNQQTLGRIRIQVVSGGELGSDSAAMEQLGFGGIAFAIVNTLSMENGMIAEGEDGTLVPAGDALNMERVDMLCGFVPDYRCIANSYGLIAFDAQCVGVNIGANSAPILSDRLGDLGFNVLPYTGADVVSSVHYGYLDGMELPLMVYATEEYAKTLPYLSLYRGPAAADVLLCSQVSMGSLSAEDQRIIRACAEETAAYQASIMGGEQTRAVANLKGKGVKFYPPEMANLPSSDWDLFGGRFIGGGLTNE